MRLILTHIFFFILSACSGSGSTNNEDEIIVDTNNPPETSGNWYKPAVSASWQWQLTGTVDTSHNVDIYDIDLFESSVALIQQLQSSSVKVICYFSAGSYEVWRSDAGSFKEADLGNNLDGWDGERWLDVRSSNVQSIMKSRLDLAVTKGCDGVEPDNMDGYTNASGFNLTSSDQLAFNRMIANEAHTRGLSVGLKNDLDQINNLVAYYDFAVNEQCFEFSECDTLAQFINNGKAVLNAEYKKEYFNDASVRDALCSDSLGRQFSTLILPLALDGGPQISCF
jgi:hypothetical protein